MPRDITIRFDDGSTHVYRRAPDDVTPEQLKARAQRDFPSRGIVNIGDAKPPAPAAQAAPPPAARPAPAAQAPRAPVSTAPLLTPDGRIPSIQQRTQDYAARTLGAWSPPDTPAPKAVAKGNIDTHNRPVVKNPDGSISTVRSITVGFGEGDSARTYVLPTVVGGRVVSEQEAIDHFRQTGEHLGAFQSLADAEDFSRRLHEDQAIEYGTGNSKLVQAREIANLFSDPTGRLRPAPPTPAPAPARAPDPTTGKGFDLGNTLRGTGEAAGDAAGGLLRAISLVMEGTGVNDAADWLTRNVVPYGLYWRDLTPEQIAAGRVIGDPEIRRFAEADYGKGGGVPAIADFLSNLDLGYEPGTTTEDVKRDFLGKALPFVAEQGIASLPAMALAAASGPALAVSQAGSIGQQRAANDQRTETTLADVIAAAPAAVASAAIERLGIDKILGAAGGNAAMRIAKASGTEAGTEFLQSGIESAGGTVGTVAGFDPGQTLEQSLFGALTGAGVGGALRTGIEAPAAIQGTVQKGADLMTALKARSQPQEMPLEALQPPEAPQAPEPAPTPPAAAPEPAAAVPEPIASPAPPATPAPAEPVVAPGPAAAPPPVPVPPAGDGGSAPPPEGLAPPRAIGPKTEARVPSTLERVGMQFEIHDLSNLRTAEGDLQNRDRGRQETEDFIREFVARFQPDMMGEDKFTDRGAPIINKDNIILSGNGRAMGIEEIYNRSPEGAEAYKQFLRDQGYDIEGIERPVLVRRILSDVDERSFVTGSNADDKANLSAPEQARQDASDVLTDELLNLYAGGDLSKTGNDGFVSSFLAKLTNRDRGGLKDKDGKVSQKAYARINNAILHKAFGNEGDVSRNFMSRVMESTDGDSKTLVRSMTEIAPAWVQFTKAMREGRVDPKYDIADKLLEAIALVGDIKARGLKVKQYLEMDDMFEGQGDPFVRQILLAFHKDDLSTFKSIKAISEILRDYVNEASDQQAGEDLLGQADTPSAEAVWRKVDRVARENPAPEDDAQGGLFDAAPTNEGDTTNGRKPALQGDEGGDRRQPQEARSQGEVRGRRERQAPQEGAQEGGRGAGARKAVSRPQGGAWMEKIQDTLDELDAELDAEVAAEAKAAREAKVAARAKFNEPVEDRSGISDDKKGAYADTYMEAAFTNRRSVYETAIEATGLTPAKFTLLPSPRQKKLLAEAFRRKFGITIVFDAKLQDRMAIDQILDAFQTVQGMASVLGINEQAMSLGGRLRIRLQKGGNFLGVFNPGNNMIGLPRRSNSFAHEWFHALDYYLQGELLVGEEMDNGLLTGNVRKGAEYDASPQFREAWTRFLNAMFFDKAGMARKIMELEAKIAATKSSKQKAAFQAQIDNFRKGASQSRTDRSAYYRSAEKVNATQGGDYWTTPTEMGARAFEAYVSMMAAQAGLTTEFIGKGDFNYRANPESRFALTFPKEAERQEIFEAISDVMVALHNDMTISGDGDPASLPPMTALRKVTDFDRLVQTKPNGTLVQREMDTWQRWMRRRAEEKAGRAEDAKTGLQRAQDVLALMAYSMAGKLKMLSRRYQSGTIMKIHDMLAWSPGRGEGVGQTFIEEVEARVNRNLNRMATILKKHGLEDLDAAAQRKLRDLLISENVSNPDPALEAAAADLRTLMDELFYDATKVGINLGYTRNGFLPRILDMPRILNDGIKFVERATEVYKLVWDKQFGEDPSEMLARDMLKAFMRVCRNHDIEGLKDLRRLLNKLASIKDGDDPDAAEAKRAELMDDILELLGEMWDPAREAWSMDKAETWHGNLLKTAAHDFDAHTPASDFTKKRELPPETDKIMEDFYLQDPLEAVQSYITQSARRVAYVRRFGAKDQKLKDMIDAMSAEGVSKEDQEEVLKVLRIAVGRQASGLPRSAEIGLSIVQAYGTIRLLSRAVLSSLVEPITAGITAGDFKKGFVALAASISGSTSLNGKQRAELARAMGIITDSMTDVIGENRVGGMFANETRADRITHNMFVRTGLVALTRAQRTHTMAVSHAYLDNLSQGAVNGDERSIFLLKELGIRDPATFAKQLLAANRMPTVEELDTKWGHDYSLATTRFINMTIQNPNVMDRPQAANNPIGRIIYGIMSFTMAFWRNVTKRQGLLLAAEYKRGGAKAVVAQGARVLPAIAALYAMQTTISIIREFFLNPERWEELEKKGELEETMLKLGFTRSFSLGILDPVVQAVTGLRYQRDLSNIFVGPSWGVMLQDTARIIQAFTRNSKKTNTGEYNAIESTYNMLIGPAIATGLSAAPAGPIFAPLFGIGTAYFTSPRMGDTVATTIVGPKGTKTGNQDDKEEEAE